MKWLLATYLVLQSLDMATTAIKVHQRCAESVWVNAPTMYATKGAAMGVTIAWGGKAPSAFAVVEGIGIGSGLYGTIHNLRTVCH